MPLDVPFDYEINHSRRKTMAIYVRDGKAEVRAPRGVSNKWVEDFIREKADWVCRQIQEQDTQREEKFELRPGKTLTYLGKPLIVALQPGRTHKVRVKDETLFIPQDDLFTSSDEYFHRWLQSQAEEYMRPRAYWLAEQLDLHDKLKEVRFKNTKSQWGHCSAQGVLQFNWLIMLAPEAVVDYLIAHEVCHLRHLNHSKAYWALVERVCPEHKESRRWLRNNEHRLQI